MANPGYPMQPMQQPPGGPGQMNPMNQMGHPGQMQQPPRAQVVRRGTSRAVPVVISAGLAVGVFCGLLFGLGVEKDEAVAATAPAQPAKKADTEVPEPFQPTTPKVKTLEKPPVSGSPIAVAAGSTPPPAGSNAVPATGSNTVAANTPGTGSAAVVAPVVVPVKATAKLTIEITPDTVAKTAKITVDGKELEKNELDVDLGGTKKREVKIVIKASGYKDVEQKLEVLAEHDNLYKVELVKRASGGGLSRPPPPGGNGNKKPPGGNKKPPGGGLIDI